MYLGYGNDISEEFLTLKERLTNKLSNHSNEKPRCFHECNIPGCDMVEEHCAITEFPPMTKCALCQFWFTNLERKQDEERRKKASVEK